MSKNSGTCLIFRKFKLQKLQKFSHFVPKYHKSLRNKRLDFVMTNLILTKKKYGI